MVRVTFALDRYRRFSMASKNSKNPPRRFADASRSLGLLVRLGDQVVIPWTTAP